MSLHSTSTGLYTGPVLSSGKLAVAKTRACVLTVLILAMLPMFGEKTKTITAASTPKEHSILVSLS